MRWAQQEKKNQKKSGNLKIDQQKLPNPQTRKKD